MADNERFLIWHNIASMRQHVFCFWGGWEGGGHPYPYNGIRMRTILKSKNTNMVLYFQEHVWEASHYLVRLVFSGLKEMFTGTREIQVSSFHGIHCQNYCFHHCISPVSVQFCWTTPCFGPFPSIWDWVTGATVWADFPFLTTSYNFYEGGHPD